MSMLETSALASEQQEPQALQVRYGEPFKITPVLQEKYLIGKNAYATLIGTFPLEITGWRNEVLKGKIDVVGLLTVVNNPYAAGHNRTYGKDDMFMPFGDVDLSYSVHVNEDGLMQIEAAKVPIGISVSLDNVWYMRAPGTEVFLIYGGKSIKGVSDRDLNLRTHKLIVGTDDWEKGVGNKGKLWIPHDPKIFEDLQILIGNKESQV